MQNKIHDVTDKFTRACKALDVGQLVKDEYFTLFESIGAIEIMDTKMDSGFLQPNETLEETFDPLAPLLPAELIGIMDQLLCYEMAWHTGYPLSQTLFTSVYIDRLLWPEAKVLERAQFYRGEIEEAKRPGTLLQVLRAYCLAVVKGCDYVIARVTARDYFEEEDFCTNTYNRVLFVSVPVDVFERELDAAVEMVEDPDLEIDDTLRAAIITRLNFRKSFLLALDIDLPLDRLSSYWPPVVGSLSSIQETHALGQPVPGAFSTKLQRRLASTVPPRPIVELDFTDALEKLKQLCTDCEEATRFTTLPLDPLEYQSFLWTFASRAPTPLPYSRSYLSNILFHPDILNSPVSLPLQDTKSLVFPSPTTILDPTNWTLSPPLNPLAPKPPRLQLALLIDEFIDRTGQPYIDLWIALGQNRCRLRRMLTHVVAAWDMLQSDAAMIDDDIHTICQTLVHSSTESIRNPLSTWVYTKKLWMIEKILLLGFEQDIYLPDEFAAMYHFLSLLSAKRAKLLHSCLDHGTRRIAPLLQARNFDDATDTEGNIAFIDAEFHLASAIAAFARALQRFYTVLLYLGVLPVPKRSCAREELRYELRMKPFLSLHPVEVPPFEEFRDKVLPYGAYDSPSPSLVTELRNPESGVWKDIDAALKEAREGFARVKKYGARACRAGGVEEAWEMEVKGLLASCVSLGLGVAGVRVAVEGVREEVGVEGLREALGIKVEIPAAGEGGRYSEGWVVGKVVKV
ncbi:amino-acid N-acetyltransferas-like protein subunit Mak10 [Byssothecium circinans]|uniref:Amino-acid N-acetyltransferas-like protein subunit Mak10 n=1 Tax=Byssothecium circinans TaxID=147558 RepID=A0A6A5TIN3_9PLEO|nr:amino-acid N-acetyltransferas-like protein subunit Mak10 [Byssothecium circinans]